MVRGVMVARLTLDQLARVRISPGLLMNDTFKILKELKKELESHGITIEIKDGSERLDLVSILMSVYYNDGQSAYDDVIETLYPSIIIQGDNIMIGIWSEKVSKVLHSYCLVDPNSISMVINEVLNFIRDIPPPS